MKTVSILTAFVVAVLSSGCATSARSEPPLTRIRTLAKGAFSGVSEAKQEVIKSPANWEKFWARHTLQSSPPEKRPPVDFRKEMVVVITMGRQRTGGYAIEIVDVKKNGGTLQIQYHQSTPEPGSITTQVLTAPFHFVAVPRTDLKAVFTEVPQKSKPPTE